jgi:predicted transcriptional regulator
MKTKIPVLTEAELKIMEIVWKLERATVSDVLAAHKQAKRPAYNTVLTLMRILEQKGYLSRAKEGRAHLYAPRVTRARARSRAIRHMARNFFGGSPEALMLGIIESEKLGAKDIERLKQMIEEEK